MKNIIGSVLEAHLVAVGGGDLRNTGAHLASTDDNDVVMKRARLHGASAADKGAATKTKHGDDGDPLEKNNRRKAA